MHICHVFQTEAEVSENKGYTSYPSFEDDCNKVVKQLEDEAVFIARNWLSRKLEASTASHYLATRNGTTTSAILLCMIQNKYYLLC